MFLYISAILPTKSFLGQRIQLNLMKWKFSGFVQKAVHSPNMILEGSLNHSPNLLNLAFAGLFAVSLQGLAAKFAWINATGYFLRLSDIYTVYRQTAFWCLEIVQKLPISRLLLIFDTFDSWICVATCSFDIKTTTDFCLISL